MSDPVVSPSVPSASPAGLTRPVLAALGLVLVVVTAIFASLSLAVDDQRDAGLEARRVQEVMHAANDPPAGPRRRPGPGAPRRRHRPASRATSTTSPSRCWPRTGA